MHAPALLAPGLLALLTLTPAALAGYRLEDNYDAGNFFSSFDFFTAPDPTHGFVEYVDANTASAEGLAGYTTGGIFMGADFRTHNPANGRKSVRVTSQKAFTHGLFLADIEHMPGSVCGSWPAFWMFGPDWPSSGEIDIIEGVNSQTEAAITLHTAAGCSVANHGALATTSLVSSECGASGGHVGCTQATADNQNYGDGFNAIGGGVYATEWTSDHIAVWFFPRHAIPADLASESPDPAGWGPPTARFVGGGGGCDIDSHFKDNNLVFDITFCGDWAGQVWGQNPECSALSSSCEAFVAGHPAAFEESYWTVNSIKVFQQQRSNTAYTAKREDSLRAFSA